MKLINPEVRIETTNACMGNCVMCPRDKMARPVMFMDNYHFRNLAAQAESFGATMISPFGFGEPLLDAGIVEKIKYCTNLDLKTFITTNATSLTVDLSYNLLDAGLSKIRFSLHGRGTNYELVHRGFSFVDTMRNVSNFLSINKINFNNACNTAVTVIPMHGERVEDIVEFWETKVDEVEVWKPHGWAGKKQYRKETPEKLKSCGRPFNGPIQIQSDAKMIVCCFDINGELEVGDTKKENIEDILRSSRFNKIRRQHETGDLSGLICESCDQLYINKNSPLLYSSRDKTREIGKTSSMKFKLKEM